MPAHVIGRATRNNGPLGKGTPWEAEKRRGVERGGVLISRASVRQSMNWVAPRREGVWGGEGRQDKSTLSSSFTGEGRPPGKRHTKKRKEPRTKASAASGADGMAGDEKCRAGEEIIEKGEEPPP